MILRVSHLLELNKLFWIFLQGKDLTRDITDPKYNSIQQAKLKEVYDKKMRKANSKKESVLRVLADHQSRFSEIINRWEL